MPNYGHLSLSCAKIERPSPLEKPSCKVRFFVQNRFREYLQKVTATTLSQTASDRVFQLLAQMAHVRFHGRKWVHIRLSEKDRTQRLARRNRGRFGWGWYHYSQRVPHVHQHPRAGYQNGKFCRFWGLVGCSPEKRPRPPLDHTRRTKISFSVPAKKPSNSRALISRARSSVGFWAV